MNNKIPYTKPVSCETLHPGPNVLTDNQAYTAVVDILLDQLTHLNTVLLERTFLVGERITLADVLVASAAAYALSSHVHVGLHDKIPNVVRYVNT
jgi:glutathione S-transferase